MGTGVLIDIRKVNEYREVATDFRITVKGLNLTRRCIRGESPANREICDCRRNPDIFGGER